MLRQEPFSFQISYVLLTLYLLTLPFNIFLLIPVGSLLLFFSFFYLAKRENRTGMKDREKTLFGSLFLLFLLLHLVGILCSDNKTLIFARLENLLWYFVVPLFFFSFNRQMTRERIEFLFNCFLLSMALAILFNYASASYDYFFKNASTYQFFYIRLSRLMHPSYHALYACVSLLLAFYFILKKQRKLPYILFSLLLLCYLFMLQSKAGIFTALPLLIFMGIYSVIRVKIKSLSFLLLILTVLFVPLLLFNIDIPVNRVEDFKDDLTYKESTVSGNPRTVIWKVAWEVGVKNLPFGVGIGDVHAELNHGYEAKGFVNFAEKNYNAHNQYLETFVGLGIFGLLSLLALFLVPLFYGIKNRNMLLTVFVLIVMFFLLFESMLERRAGSDFIPLFLGLLIWMPPSSSFSQNLSFSKSGSVPKIV